MLPAASILPRSMMPIDVQKSASSERIWLEIRMVLPICLSSFKSAFISSRALGSRPEAGSSRIKHGRVVDQGLGQAEPLFHPLGEPVDVVVALVGQVEKVEHFADDLLAVRPRDLVGDREEIEKLPDLHAVVDAEVVGHEADHAAHGHRLGRHRKAGDPPLAGRRPQQRRQEPDRRALARAIGPDETEDLTLADGEAQVVDGDEVSVTLGEVDHLDHEIVVLRL